MNCFEKLSQCRLCKEAVIEEWGSAKFIGPDSKFGTEKRVTHSHSKHLANHIRGYLNIEA